MHSCAMCHQMFPSIQFMLKPMNCFMCVSAAVLRETSMSPCQSSNTSANHLPPPGASFSLVATSANGIAVQNKVPPMFSQQLSCHLKPYSDGTSFLNNVWVTVLITRRLWLHVPNSDRTNISVFITGSLCACVHHVWHLFLLYYLLI